MNITNWFTGVVEDVNDPMQMGRVRVRCFNYHSPSIADIPTQDLPWSTCILPVTSASISGIGQSATGLIPGSWVFGFFRDGLELQDSVVLGSIPSASTLPGERGNGFADPHGSYPNLLGNDTPAGATTYGYGSNDGFNSQRNAFSSFNSTVVGQGTTATTLHGPLAPIQVNGSVDKIINAGRGEVGVIETSKNQGAGIQKYWAATDYKGGYNDRAPWCAAFVCWCIQLSGIFSEADRPKSASTFKGGGFEAWARSKSSNIALTVRPTQIRAGDLVVFSLSHIGIATTASDLNGVFRTIEGNTDAAGGRGGNGVWEKSRRLSLVRSAITIKQ